MTDKMDSRLVEAIIRGDFSAVKSFVESGVKCNGVYKNPKNVDRKTFLHFAVISGKANIVQYLIEQKGVDVNKKCVDGRNALHFAVHFDHYETLKLLVKNGADCNAVDELGDSPCHAAAIKGHSKMIKFLVKVGKADINKSNIVGASPFHGAAAAIKDVNFLKLLIDLGADCTTLDISGRSALFYAGVLGHVYTMKFLIDEKHLDPNKCSSDGENLLHHLLYSEDETQGAKKDQDEVIEYLVKERKVNLNKVNHGGVTPLHLACLHRDLKVVKLLIDGGADYNAIDSKGDSLMHKAALLGKVDIIKYLSEVTKVDVNAGNFENETPLHFACKSGELGSVKLLLDKGADINSVDDSGLYCMHFATMNGRVNIVKYLAKERKLDVNRTTMTGVTPLHTAAAHGHVELCKFFIDLGVDYELRDIQGSCGFHFAALKGHVNVLQYFIKELGQNVNTCVTKCGATPLHFACGMGHLDCVKLLFENGADCNLLDYKGRSCLGYATRAPNRKVYEYLVRVKNMKDVATPLELLTAIQRMSGNSNDCNIS